MRLDDSIDFLYFTDQWTEATSGLINVEITRGVDKYIGPWQQPDAGILTLVTRNPDLDPYINSNIRINTKVRIEATDGMLFTGWISDINVEYQPNGEPAIITIQAIDAIGRLQKTSISESFETYLRGLSGNGVTIGQVAMGIDIYATELADVGILFLGESPKDSELTYAPKAGETYWDVLAQYAENLLGLWIVDTFGVLTYLPNNKYWVESDQDWYVPAQELPVQKYFASDGSADSYKNILLDAGFDRTINQVSFKNGSRHYNGASNFDETSTEWGPYVVSDSISEWGAARLDMETIYSEALEVNNTFEILARDILEVTANPSIEVLEITYDANKYGFVDIPYKINIKHDVTNAIQIDKDYNVIGIKHSINNTQWLSTLILRDFLTVEEMIDEPIIVMDTATTGDSNFNFSAHLSNATALDIDSVLWDFAGWSLTPSTNTSTSLTPTWNYDYSPSKDWYGAGYYSIAVYVTNNSGWTRRSFLKDINGDEVQLEVTAATPNANFTYTTATTGVTNFTDISYDADTWSWNFGDGNTSTLQNPTHTYATTGTYSVSLTVSNGVTTNTETKSIDVTVSFIPVRYIKYHINGSKTRTGGVWSPNKSWFDIKEMVGIYRYSPSGTYPWESTPSTITTTKGHVYLKNSSGTTLSTINQGQTVNIGGELTDISGTRYIAPYSEYLNSGNTEELDITIIQDLSQIDNDSSTGVNIQTNGSWESYKYKLDDVMLTPKNNYAGITYFPIDVYVSGDGTTWKKIGELDPTSTYSPPTYFYLKNKVSMPPTP